MRERVSKHWGVSEGRMRQPIRFHFSQLSTAALHVDAVYEGGRRGNASDDPFPALLNVSNMGGFRYRGSVSQLEMLVLTSGLNDPDWPDGIDREAGVFTYFGDNKRPGRLLHETPRRGNQLLRQVFQNAHDGREGRLRVPPIFVFGNVGTWRDVLFIGLAVPGNPHMKSTEDLVAIWRSTHGQRFQNYRAKFTILDVPVISREWIRDIISGTPHSSNTPKAWTRWVRTGDALPLLAPRSIEYRTKSEQAPEDQPGRAMIAAMHSYFCTDPYSFEYCAAKIAKVMLPDVTSLDVTRPSRDGGRDGVGQLRIGSGVAAITVDFALEAKCYGPNNSVGVKEVSRLISRLRHRQFGILITTSYLDLQAYREIKEDGHPIVVIAARDIVELLRKIGLTSETEVTEWLNLEFPRVVD